MFIGKIQRFSSQTKLLTAGKKWEGLPFTFKHIKYLAISRKQLNVSADTDILLYFCFKVLDIISNHCGNMECLHFSERLNIRLVLSLD